MAHQSITYLSILTQLSKTYLSLQEITSTEANSSTYTLMEVETSSGTLKAFTKTG